MKKEKPDIETFAAEMADKEDNPPIHELAKEFPSKSYRELEKFRDADRREEANQVPLTQAQKNLVEHIEAAVKKSKARSGTCITEEMRKDRIPLDETKRLTSEVAALKQQLYVDKKEADESLANALEVNESHQRLNGKLQVRIAELEDENKKMHDTLEKQLDGARKAGL